MRRAVGGLLGILVGPLQALPWRAAALISPRTRLHGIEIVDLCLGKLASAAHFARIDDALALITRYEPRRMRRIRADLDYILIVDQAGPEYWPRMRACVLTPSVLSIGTEDIAFAIVHEATHSRLENSGIRYREKSRERIERICVAQEAAFAANLPDGDRIAASRLNQLMHPWWGTQALFERRLNVLVHAGLPGWLLNAIRVTFRPR